MSSFPQSFDSTVSHWQATNCGPSSLYNHGRDVDLPASADIVIIGAGMTGASLAYQLTRPENRVSSQSKIVVLEAKDVASGATGRNGGHVRPASFLSYPGLIKPLAEGGAGHTPAEAVAILEDEEENMRLVEEIVRKEGMNDQPYTFGGVEWEKRDSIVGKFSYFRAYRTVTERDFGKQALEDYQAARIAHGLKAQEGILFVDNPEEAKKLSRTSIAIACSVTPAAFVHPHKLATALLNLALKSEDCTLHSWTPVSSIDRSAGGMWNVKTERGMIKAKNVVLASNAHTKHIWHTPEMPFEDLITSWLAHCCLITPPTSHRGSGALTHSLAFSGTYLRDAASNGIVLGCGASTLREYGLAKPEEISNVVDDSVVLPKVEKYLARVLSETYTGWIEKGRGEGLTRTWSGIMGYSRDKLPFIGPVPGEHGLWAAVAFHGHGMSRILCCTRALASQMNHPNSQWDERLPRSFEITPERIKRALEAPPLYTAQPALTEQGLPKDL